MMIMNGEQHSFTTETQPGSSTRNTLIKLCNRHFELQLSYSSHFIMF